MDKFVCKLIVAAGLFLAPLRHSMAAEGVDYVKAVKPILAARCYACHGSLKQKESLRVDTVELMKKGGKGGPAIVPGKSDKSLLIDHILEKNDASRMPPESEGEALKPAEVATLKAWIDAGAIGPADEKAEADPRDHWAFKPPVKPVIAKAGNPIDVLISAEWEKRGLTPQPPASKSLLLRRVYLDLIGMPPTREELAAFMADISANAYEKVVDQLLASPRYGERWGRHWMDIWRYSDWWGLGAELRSSQKHIWHWRDWIIESINADKGYDQMVREMIAADELYPTDQDRLRGGGFLARQYFRYNRNTWLEETIEHTSKAFLGLTFNCAKCHDHKFDPLSQKEYYQFRAFFEPYQLRMDVVGAQMDFEKDGIPRAFDCNLDAPTYMFRRGDERQPIKDKPLSPGTPAILAFDQLAITPVKLPLEAYATGLRASVIDNALKTAEASEAEARKSLDAVEKATSQKVAPKKTDDDLAEDLLDPKKKPEKVSATATTVPSDKLDELKLAAAKKTLAAASAGVAAVKARIAADKARYQTPPAAEAKALAKAAAQWERKLALAMAEETVSKGELEFATVPPAQQVAVGKKIAAAKEAASKAQKGMDAPATEAYTSLRGALKTMESNVETEESRSKPFPATSTGRRTALANWLTDPRNPLPARVAVNHIWARHFGKPLVTTVFDFGRKGAAPTHPELLDFLAVELTQNGWSTKRLHRLMVTSNLYRMSSSSAGASAADLSVDPENKYYWKRHPARMEAEVVRDSLLQLAGELDLTTGGPPIAVTDETTKRRSLYFMHSHNDHQKFLATFDGASVLECYRRGESVVPQQALALENGKMVMTAAAKIAGRIKAADDAAFIDEAFLLILGAPPTADERAACQSAMKELKELAKTAKSTDAAARARVDLVHALLNHNDFVTIR